jgi:biotin carboxyl carrier protein
MKLRISVEDRTYDVEVDILDHQPSPRPVQRPSAAAVPESVLRARPQQSLPEDCTRRSPIAGRVAAILAAAGSPIRRNEPVVLLEAMKMEVPIGPAVDGTVKAILVEVGDTVAAGHVLFEMLP